MKVTFEELLENPERVSELDGEEIKTLLVSMAGIQSHVLINSISEKTPPAVVATKEEKILDLKELCDKYRFKKSWVYARIHQKKIPYLKAGQKLLFNDSEMKEFFARHRVDQ